MLLAYLVAMETAAPDPTSWLINYGVAGIVIALLVLGRLRTKSEVDGLVKALDQAHADLVAERAANAALVVQITSALPQIAALADVLDRVPVVVQKPAETGLEHTLAQIAGSLARLEQTSTGHSGGSA